MHSNNKFMNEFKYMAYPDFIQQYFLDPIINYSGYNFVNTLAYGIILLIVAFYLVYPFFNKKGIKFDFRFAIAALAFVLFGSTIRILEDLKIFPRAADPLNPAFYTITPGIYIAVGTFTILALIFSLWLSKKINKDAIKIFGIIGIAAAIPFVAFDFLNFKEPFYFALILVAWIAVMALSYFIAKKLKPELVNDNLNLLAVGGQALDGTATFVATQLLTCGEQHPLSNAILGVAPALFIVVKIAVAFAIIYYVDKEIEDPNLRGFIKIFILILGFAPGIRDAFTVGVGTCS